MYYLSYIVVWLLVLLGMRQWLPFIFLGVCILMCIGLYNPKLILWTKSKKNINRMNVMKWYGIVACLVVAIVGSIGINHTVDLPPKLEIQQVQNQTQDQVQSQLQCDTLEVHFIDIGQGDAVLVDYDDFEMLIDGGDNKTSQQLIEYLQQQKVEVIDYLIATHMDADHIGGLDVVLSQFELLNIIDSGTKKDTKTYKDYERARDKENASYIQDEHQVIEIDEALSLKIIETGDTYKDENDNSVVIQLSYFDKNFLFTGDMEAHAEEAALKYFEDIDVLKAGHHGSRTSSSEAFLNSTKPEVAVISCGISNKYGHPHQETLDKYKKRNMSIYRTDQQGHIIATVDASGHLTWQTQN